MQLLERHTAGLHVQLDWRPRTNIVWLICECNGHQVQVDVPPDKVLDAFDHPIMYLPEQDQQLMFVQPTDD